MRNCCCRAVGARCTSAASPSGGGTPGAGLPAHERARGFLTVRQKPSRCQGRRGGPQSSPIPTAVPIPRITRRSSAASPSGGVCHQRLLKLTVVVGLVDVREAGAVHARGVVLVRGTGPVGHLLGGVELPWLLPPTPVPDWLVDAALDPLFAKPPLSACATPVKSAAAKGSAAAKAMTRAVRVLAMSIPPTEHNFGTCWNSSIRRRPTLPASPLEALEVQELRLFTEQLATCRGACSRRRELRIAHRIPGEPVTTGRFPRKHEEPRVNPDRASAPPLAPLSAPSAGPRPRSVASPQGQRLRP